LRQRISAVGQAFLSAFMKEWTVLNLSLQSDGGEGSEPFRIEWVTLFSEEKRQNDCDPFLFHKKEGYRKVKRHPVTITPGKKEDPGFRALPGKH